MSNVWAARLVGQAQTQMNEALTKPPFPNNNLIACLGDSSTFLNYADNPATSTPLKQQCRGYAFWAQMLSGARVQFPQEYNFGISGQTSGQILARVDQAVQSPCSAVVVMAGTNDYATSGSTPPEEVIANLEAIVSALRDAGKIVFLYTILPRGLPGAYFWSFAQAFMVNTVNRWILSEAPRIYGVIPLSAWDRLADPSEVRAPFKTGMVSPADVSHLTTVSAYYHALPLAAEIKRMWPARNHLVATNGDIYNNPNNLTGAVNRNPMMVGTGGTLGATPTPTGVVADDWTLGGNDNGFTLAGSKVVSALNGMTMQQMTVGGTPTAAIPYCQTSQSISVGTFPLSVGDWIVASAYVEADASSGVSGISLQVNQVDGAAVTTLSACGDSGHATGSTGPNVAFSGELETPPIQVGSLPLGSLQLRCRVFGELGVPITATVRFGAVSLRSYNPN